MVLNIDFVIFLLLQLLVLSVFFWFMDWKLEPVNLEAQLVCKRVILDIDHLENFGI